MAGLIGVLDVTLSHRFKSMYRLIIVLIVFITSIIGVVYGNDFLKIEIAEKKFCIPSYYVPNEKYIFDWIYKLPGLDKKSEGFMYEINSDEIKKTIPDYLVNSADQKVTGLVQYLSYEDRELSRTQSGLSDVWLKRGAYIHRRAIKDESLGLVKVFSSPEEESNRQWDLFFFMPDEKVAVPDIYSFYAGSCQSGFEYDGNEFAICRLRFLIEDDLKASVTITSYNLHLHEEIKKYISQTIKKWKECS